MEPTQLKIKKFLLPSGVGGLHLFRIFGLLLTLQFQLQLRARTCMFIFIS